MSTFGNLVPPTMSTSAPPMSMPKSYDSRYGAAAQPFRYSGHSEQLVPEQPQKSAFSGPRRRMNPIPVALTCLLPWVLFCGVFGILSFSLHYIHPGLCWAVVLAALVVVGICGLYAARTLSLGKDSGQDPTWIIVFSSMCLVAWVLGVLLGVYNFGSCMSPHYDIMSLNTYTNVDVGQISGSAVMDAGHLTFEAGSFIDISKAAAFKDVTTYCVAPISTPVRGTAGQLMTYDFWAGGVNCCSGDFGAITWKCTDDAVTTKVTGGPRILDNAEIAKLTLATEQAASYFHFNVGHPIFLSVTADPLSGEGAALESGLMFYCLWCLLFFGLNLLFVAAILILFSKHV